MATASSCAYAQSGYGVDWLSQFWEFSSYSQIFIQKSHRFTENLLSFTRERYRQCLQEHKPMEKISMKHPSLYQYCKGYIIMNANWTVEYNLLLWLNSVLGNLQTYTWDRIWSLPELTRENKWLYNQRHNVFLIF